jgi:hypothetical protein
MAGLHAGRSLPGAGAHSPKRLFPQWYMATLLLNGDLARAEPKKLRYRLLHVPARIARTARRTWLRIANGWPWAEQIITAFARLAALPRPLI